MTATGFEFRHRFWCIAGIYALGFGCSAVDHRPLAQVIVDAAVGADAPAARSAFQITIGAAALIALAAACLRTWGTAYLQTDVMQDQQLRADRVVADGPYRYVRNPLYVGGTLLGIAIGVLASRAGFVVIAAGLSLFYYRLIRLEEGNIERQLGEPYREFCRRVPRLLPSLRPRVPASGARPRWGQALVGEIFMWAFFAGLALLAATMNLRWLWTCFAGGLVIHLGVGQWLDARRARGSRS